MKEYKILTFEEVKDYIWLSREAWDRVRSAPKEEYIQALRSEFTQPEGFLEQMKGKSLENYNGLQALIVDDGILLGVCIKAWGASDFSYPWGIAAFPYHNIITYYASDDNGSGSKDREDYAHLCCVVPDKND